MLKIFTTRSTNPTTWPKVCGHSIQYVIPKTICINATDAGCEAAVINQIID